MPRTADGPLPQHVSRPSRSGKAQRLRARQPAANRGRFAVRVADRGRSPVRSTWAGPGVLERPHVFGPHNPLRTGTVRGPSGAVPCALSKGRADSRSGETGARTAVSALQSSKDLSANTPASSASGPGPFLLPSSWTTDLLESALSSIPANWFALSPDPALTEPVINEPFFPTPDILKAGGEAQIALHDRAARTAAMQFGPKVFLRGVVEVSNYCRE